MAPLVEHLAALGLRHTAEHLEGFNNKARVTTRTAYGFRTYRVMGIALYHTLGALPEPKTPHRFY